MSSDASFARTEAEAIARFIGRLQQIIGCVSQDVVHVFRGGYHSAGQPHMVVVDGGRPIRLRRDPALLLDVALRYVFSADPQRTGGWMVELVEYIYSLRLSDGVEFLAFHWHPDPNTRVQAPHLHLRDIALSEASPLHRVHVPTGYVDLEAVIRMAIEEYGVQPRRRDWRTVLLRKQAISYRTPPVA